jgi:glyoxylase-like metal-dependent hydrolase (beta-lactamase superfamily II)
VSVSKPKQWAASRYVEASSYSIRASKMVSLLMITFLLPSLIQFGIPPETIKDSMKLGLPVPQVYIVPVERFCREIGPALGVNLAEFEFPAYFNFFVYKKRCTLVVDCADAEENIRRVFSETLLGPAQFRQIENPIAYEPEDFASDFPKEAIPNFQKELQHFRIMPDGKELVIETLLDFRHFEMRTDGHDHLGVPPPIEGEPIVDSSEKADAQAVEAIFGGEEEEEEDIPEEAVPTSEEGVERRETKAPWTYSHARFMGKMCRVTVLGSRTNSLSLDFYFFFEGDVATVWPTNATEEQIKNRSIPRVEIFKMPGGTEYIIHDVDERNFIIGKARLSGHVKVSESMSVDGFGGHSILDDFMPSTKSDTNIDGDSMLAKNSESSRHMDDIFPHVAPPTFHPPSFGVTVLGNSHGFDKSGSVSGYVLWINGRGVMIDPPPYSSATLEREGIRPRTIVGIILTHCHADHDAGAFQKVLTGSPVVVITTPTIYKSFIRKYAALSALSPALLRHSHRFKPAIIGQPLRFQGATFHFTYTLHTIPCVGFRVEWRGRSMVFTGDHFNSPEGMDKLEASGVLSKARADDLRHLPLQECDLLLHEAGAPPIHTPLEVLLQLPEAVKKRLYVVHTSALPPDCELKAAPTGTKGTIRLDQLDQAPHHHSMRSLNSRHEKNTSSFTAGDDEYDNVWSGCNEYETVVVEGDRHVAPAPRTSTPSHNIQSSFVNLEFNSFGGGRKGRNSVFVSAPGRFDAPPLVALRPSSSTDAWFILNLLSAVPFLSRYVSLHGSIDHVDALLSWNSHVAFAVFRIRLQWSS